MEEKIDDETLDNSMETQTENHSEEIITTQDLENNKPIQEEPNMEVHHHTHNPAEPHHKKNWKSYFWEFLMLFLAVFCGFLAEYKLEHVIEHQREKTLVSSLLSDLKKDSANISQVKSWEEYRSMMDSLGTEIKKPFNQRNNKSLYKWFATMRSFGAFEYHNRTIEQLKNGGNFRLITHKIVSDSLIDYDSYIISRLRDQEEQSKVIYQRLNFLQDKFINAEYYDLVFSSEVKFDSVYNANPDAFKIVESNKDYLFEYYNNVKFFKSLTEERIYTLKNMKRMNDNLLQLILKEYEIK
jgi:hypothetical protein